jgi:hypothetical protein
MATYTKLSADETTVSGMTHKLVITYTDLLTLTSGTAYSVLPRFNAATTIPAQTRILDCYVRIDTAFAKTDTNATTILVGDGGDTGRFIASTSILSGVGIQGVQSKMPYSYLVADTVDIIVTVAVSGLMTDFTAGQLTIFFALAYMGTE